MEDAATQAKKSPRRKRRDRSLATRARILDAVVKSIDEVGFAGTTSQRIARGAGVSVGAVQHHFPAKADILAVVLERSYENLSAQFEGIRVDGAPLEERVAVFVDRAWLHYGSAAFRSTLEILSNARRHAPDGGEAENRLPIRESAQRATSLWNAFFAGDSLSPEHQREIRHFAFASLAGLAIATRLQPAHDGMRPQVDMLKTALVALFEQKRGETGSGRAEDGSTR